ncbi:MAG: hypothetical protein AAF587_10535 [Bacteroidota bacterium]
MKEQLVKGQVIEVLDLLLSRATITSLQHDLLNVKRRWLEFEQLQHRDTISLNEREMLKNNIFQVAFSLIDRVEAQ